MSCLLMISIYSWVLSIFLVPNTPSSKLLGLLAYILPPEVPTSLLVIVKREEFETKVVKEINALFRKSNLILENLAYTVKFTAS